MLRDATQLSGLGAGGSGGAGGESGGGGEHQTVQPDPFAATITAGRGTGGALAYYQAEVVITERPSNPLKGYTEVSRFIRILNPLQKPDDTAQAVHIYYGDQTTQRRLIDAGSSSEFLPLRSADELWLRVKKTQGTAFVVIEVFH